MSIKNTKASEAVTEQTMPGPGRQLREERLQRDMTLEQVAEALHLNRKIIEHLEADNYAALPPLTFVQGYVRSYSQLLGIPAEPLLAALAEAAGDDASSPLIARAGTDSFGGAKPRAALRTGPGFLTLALIILLLLAALGAVGWWLAQNQQFMSSESEDSAPAAESQTEVESEAEAAQPIEAEPITEPASGPDRAPEPLPESEPQPETAPEPAAQPQPEPQPEPQSEPEPAPEAETETPRQSAVEPDSVAAAGVDALLFTLSGDSWLEVTDGSGERLYFGMASAGEERLVGEPPFDIVIGNTDFVELEFSGEAVDLQAYARDKVARFTLDDS